MCKKKGGGGGQVIPGPINKTDTDLFIAVAAKVAADVVAIDVTVLSVRHPTITFPYLHLYRIWRRTK